jgi:hypothetical protein
VHAHRRTGAFCSTMSPCWLHTAFAPAAGRRSMVVRQGATTTAGRSETSACPAAGRRCPTVQVCPLWSLPARSGTVQTNRLAKRWLPPARVKHPFPNVRFNARTQGKSPVLMLRTDLVVGPRPRLIPGHRHRDHPRSPRPGPPTSPAAPTPSSASWLEAASRPGDWGVQPGRSSPRATTRHTHRYPARGDRPQPAGSNTPSPCTGVKPLPAKTL